MKKLFAALLVCSCLLGAPFQAFATSPVPSTPSGIPVSEIEEKTDQIMEKFIGSEVPGVSISIVKDGEIVLLKGYGYSNVEEQIPMSAETTYMEAGSVSKLFTWTAVMQLVEQGKLDLEADIREYLPDNYLMLAFDKPVTLNHLMSHTAGFEERLEGLLVEDIADYKPLEEHMAPSRQPKQIYEPGSVIAYSNYGTNLAGYIVEIVSGMPFEQFIHKFTFEPLDMERAFFSPRYDLIPEVIRNKAVGYSKMEGEWKAQPNIYINDMPAGSLNITAENMAHFMLAHLNADGSSPYRLFNKNETLQQMHEVSYTHHPKLPGNAHGFWEHLADNHRVLEHGGNTMAFTALLSIVPEENFGISILTNVESEMSGARKELIDLFIGSPYTDPQPGSELNHSSEVEGRYRSARAVDSGFMKVTSVLSDIDTVITANSDGSINLSVPYMGISIDYVETSPYLYERKEPGNTIMDLAGLNLSRLFFVTDDHGKVIQLSYGTIADELPVAFYQTAIFNYVLLGVSGLIFLLGCILGIIGWLRGAKAKRRHHASTILIAVLGLLKLGNLTAAIIKIAGSPFQPMSNFNLNILLFWLLGISFVPAIYFAIRNWKLQENTFTNKIITVLLVLAFLAVSFFLYSYHFYTL